MCEYNRSPFLKSLLPACPDDKWGRKLVQINEKSGLGRVECILSGTGKN